MGLGALRGQESGEEPQAAVTGRRGQGTGARCSCGPRSRSPRRAPREALSAALGAPGRRPGPCGEQGTIRWPAVGARAGGAPAQGVGAQAGSARREGQPGTGRHVAQASPTAAHPPAGPTRGQGSPPGPFPRPRHSRPRVLGLGLPAAAAVDADAHEDEGRHQAARQARVQGHVHGGCARGWGAPRLRLRMRAGRPRPPRPPAGAPLPVHVPGGLGRTANHPASRLTPAPRRPLLRGLTATVMLQDAAATLLLAVQM